MAFCSQSRHSFESDEKKSANDDILPKQDPSVQHLMRYYQCRHYGWIKKQGGNHKNWKLRFMILCQGCLYYYENEESVKPKGHVVLNNYRACPAPEMRKMPWVFKLLHLHPYMRTYYVSCKNRDEMMRWIDMIGKDIEIFCSSDDWGHGSERYEDENISESQRRNYFDESEISTTTIDYRLNEIRSTSDFEWQTDPIDKSTDRAFSPILERKHTYLGGKINEVSESSQIDRLHYLPQSAFIGKADVGEALRLLHQRPIQEGLYLIRESKTSMNSTMCNMILTVGTEDIPLHYRILYFNEKGWTLDRISWFEQLDQLIRYYYSTNLPNSSCKLTRAYTL